jgi:hypothetical protein
MLKTRILSLIALVCVLMSLGSADVPTAKADGQATGAEVKYRNDLSAEELGMLLGAYVWKFDVVIPPGTQQITAAFQERDKSGANTGLGSMTAPVDASMPKTLLVAIIPIGDDITGADKIRVVLTGFNSSMSQTIDNPFKNFVVGGPRGEPDRYVDGAYGLIGAFSGGQISTPITTQADSVIALQVMPQGGQ